jgi:putative protease
MVGPARELGYTLRGDFGLPVFNAQALKEYKHMGFVSATASFELKLAQIRDLSKALPLEAVVYGRLPLMITENCIIKNRTGQCTCQGENILTDRKGERFPVVKAPGCRSEILNSKKLFLADKPDWKRVGLTYARLLFTTENPWECAQALERYRGESQWAPAEFTRGLYYRGVE